MCTVSFLPTAKGCIITSNRDEKETRSKAIVPKRYDSGEYTLVYPEDAAHKGTWIAAKDNGDVAVLLNGAFEKHEPGLLYEKSRGLVLLELIRSAQPRNHWQQIDLEKTEPFTLVFFSGGRLSEYCWDGSQKHQQYLDHHEAHIWSSVTLYDAAARAKRKQWFSQWKKKQVSFNAGNVFDFHLHTGKEDPYNGLIIDRNGAMKTQSITQVEYSGEKTGMRYLDLATLSTATCDIDIHAPKQAPAPKSGPFLQWKIFLTRLLHWEFWPFGIVYGPIMFYWVWLAIRSRSFFFFGASNPSIENGGFVLERKSDIYRLIPEKYIPKTILVKKATDPAKIRNLVSENKLSFPIIAKPDIGMRGMGVQLIKTSAELEMYRAKSKVNFLLQEFVPYPNEVGIFYCRIPGDANGKITGIVGKEFLSVRGNGISTIAELLFLDPRYLLQYDTLRKNAPDQLNRIPAKDEIIELVPYGNHARGAKFIDLSDRVDDPLHKAIDDICRQIPGFYFGRLDIRYENWEQLCKGEKIAIIELNGAGSEPAHIYDPSHSIFFAWKEIIRHWNILYRISRKNRRLHTTPHLPFKEGVRLLKKNSAYIKQLASS